MPKKLFLLFVLSFFLIACASKEDKVLEEIEAVHTELTAMEILVEEVANGNTTVMEEYIHFEDELYKTYNAFLDSTTYKDDQSYYSYTPSGFPPFPPGKEGTLREAVNQKIEIYKNPFSFFEAFDPDFRKHLEVTENEDKNEYILQYEPKDEETKEEFYEGFIRSFLIKARDANNETDDIESMEFDMNDFNLHIHANHDTKEITEIKMEEDATVSLGGTDLDLERETSFLFSEFNEEQDFDIPKDAMDISK